MKPAEATPVIEITGIPITDNLAGEFRYISFRLNGKRVADMAVGKIALNAGAIIAEEKIGKRYSGYNTKNTRKPSTTTAAIMCKRIGT